MVQLKAKDVMSTDLRTIKPTQTVKEAAMLMKEVDCGVLPVGDAARIVGMITDRDIVLRVAAEGRDAAKTAIQDVMTKKHHSCKEEDSLETVAELMREHNVRRVLVTKQEALIGIISLKNMMNKLEDAKVRERLIHILFGEEQRKAFNTAA